MPTIEYIRRFPKEAYGYEEVKAVCATVEEMALVVLEIDTWRMERPINPDDVPFEPKPADEDGYYDEPPAKPARSVAPTRQRGAQGSRRQQPRGVACGLCGGPTWDNREGKRTGKASERAPDFKCKDKDECGGAMWLTADGEHGEWKD